MRLKNLYVLLFGIILLAVNVRADIVVLNPVKSFFSYVWITLPLTILIEFGIIWLFIRKDPIKLLSYLALINVITFFAANYLYYILKLFFVIETGVVIVESFLIMGLLKQKYPKSLLISFTANITTAVVGIGISMVIITL